jgi:hypothetical protein
MSSVTTTSFASGVVVNNFFDPHNESAKFKRINTKNAAGKKSLAPLFSRRIKRRTIIYCLLTAGNK